MSTHILSRCSGIDNVSAQNAGTFQGGEGQRGPIPYGVTAALDCDLDSDGGFACRLPSADVLGLTTPQGLWSAGGMLLAQDGIVFGKVTGLSTTPALSALAIGVTGTVELTELGGVVYWSDGTQVGTISGGVASNWGMTVPPVPTLTTTTGTTPAGRYQVAITLEDAAGRESGVLKAGLITLATSLTDIVATLSSYDSNATHVNVYASSGENQKEVFWVKKVAVGALPTTITAAQLRTSTRPLRTQHLRGPVPCSRLFTYQSFLMLIRDSVVFRSHGLSPHLFNVRQDIFPHPSNVLGGVGVADGFWTTTSDGLWWWTGEPGNWKNVLKDRRAYAAGMAQIPGGWIPKLETEELIGIFVSEEGPVAALPSGRAIPLTQNRYHCAVTGKAAHIVVYLNALSSGAKVRQIAFTLN